MIGDSLPEYVFIRISIALLRVVAPLCIVYTAASWYSSGWIYSKWIGYYALLESAFYLFVYLPRNWYLQRRGAPSKFTSCVFSVPERLSFDASMSCRQYAGHSADVPGDRKGLVKLDSSMDAAVERPPLLPRKDREALFDRCFSMIRHTDMATGWFYSAPMNSIRRDNMFEWLSWALFGAHPDALKQPDFADEIDGYIAKLEKFQGFEYQRGHNARVRCMKVSIDPVVGLHRPFVWYMIVAAVDTITGLILLSQGFRYYNNRKSLLIFPPRLHPLYARQSPDADIVYWYRPHRSTTKAPVLFLHGIGIGLWPYTPLFAELLATDPDVGILAIENLPISMRIYAPPLTRTQMLASLTRILDHHRLPRVVVAAHSYGTILAAHMLRDPNLAPRVASLLLVDPIPFLLHLPAVAYNFVYRVPRTANEWQLWFFASRDPDIARALARHFFWHENLLWREDLDGRSAGIVLGGRDQIVDAPEVRRYLTGEDDARFRCKRDGLEVLYYEGLDHQMALSTKERRKPILDMLRRFVREEAAESN